MPWYEVKATLSITGTAYLHVEADSQGEAEDEAKSEIEMWTRTSDIDDKIDITDIDVTDVKETT